MTTDSVKKYQIPMTDKVVKEIKKAKNETPFSRENILSVIGMSLFPGFVLAGFIALAWRFLDWSVSELFSPFNIGWAQFYCSGFLWVIFLISYLFVFVLVSRAYSRTVPEKKLLENDLKEGVVDVFEYPIYEAKVFEEIEHGGFVYFLRTVNDKVLALYDYESIQLSMDEKDPFDSSYKVREIYKVLKTPNAKYLIGEQFHGGLIKVLEVKPLTLDNGIWPEHSEIVDCDWCDVESRFGKSC